MSNIKKYVWVVLATIALACIAVFSLWVCKDDSLSISVSIDRDGIKETIRSWYDESARINYFFLPSYSDSDNTQITIGSGEKYSCNGETIKDGDNPYLLFEMEKLYTVENSGKFGKKGKIKIIKAENVSTMFVNTSTGSMKEVFYNKDHSEPVSVTVLTVNGEKDIFEKEGSISGHGNTTWKEDKKPFSLKFDAAESILGMQVSSKWILLADARDASHLKNKMILDLAKEIGIPYSSECEYVMLYLNGEYYGIFLLCQSVNTIQERAEGSAADLKLCKFELTERVKESEDGILVGERKLPIEYKIPHIATDNEIKEITEKIATTDKAICEGLNGDADISDYIDIDSWTKKYLIDDVFENYDAGICSAYFYWNTDAKDGRIFAGPIWDYDNSIGQSFGLFSNPEIIMAAQERRNPQRERYWYPELYKNDEFYNSVVTEYKNYFSSKIGYLISDYIPNEMKRYSVAFNCEDIRWKKDSKKATATVVEYLQDRKNFLDSYWIEEDVYNLVKYHNQSEGDYQYAYVPQGKTIFDTKYVGSTFNNKKYVAYNEDTGERFDTSQAINKDVNLVFVDENSSLISQFKSVFYTIGYIITPMSVALIVLICLILLAMEKTKEAGKNDN